MTRYGVFFVLAILVAGSLCSWWLLVRADHRMRAGALEEALLLAEAVNPRRIQTLTGTAADVELPEYQRLQQQFLAVLASNPHWRYIYVMGHRPDGDVFFLLDIQDDSRETTPPALPGEVYEEASDAMVQVFLEGRPVVEGPLPDEWGTWVSPLVPLTDSRTGHVIAVLGMDIDALAWRRDLVVQAVLPAGLATFALMAIALVGCRLLQKRARLEGEASRRMQEIEPGIVVAVGTVLTVFVAWLVQRESTNTQDDSFRHLAESRTALLADGIHDLSESATAGLASFIEASEEVTFEEFLRYTRYLTRNAMVQSWEWIPIVHASDKQPFERAARASGLNDFEIWQHDATGRRVPAQDRSLYYPVYRVAPQGDNHQRIGFDLGSNLQGRLAIEEAFRTGLPTATSPLSLLPGDGEQKEMLFFRPVFEDASLQRPRGLVLAVVGLENMLAATDSDAVMAEELLLVHHAMSPESLALSWTLDEPPSPHLVATRPVFSFGRTFMVVARAGPEFERLHSTTRGLNAFLIGSILTAAAALVLSLLQRRHHVLEGLVRQRTWALRASQQHLTATLRSIGDGVIVCDPAGRVTSMNPVAESLTGWTNAQSVGRPLDEVLQIVDARTLERANNPVTRALAEGVNVEMSNHITLIARDGQRYQIADSCAPIRDTWGTVIGAVLVFRDVTQEYRQREQLREERERLAHVMKVTGSNIFVLDPELNLHFVDQAYREMYGDPAGRKCYEYLMGTGEACANCGVLNALETKEMVVTERMLPKENNRVVQVHAVPFQDAAGKWLVAEYVVDITDRKRAEQHLREFQTAVEQSADGIVLTDMDGKVQFANDAWADLHGYSVDEILGRHLSIFHNQGQMEGEVNPFIEQLIDENSRESERKFIQKGELGHIRKDGSAFRTQMTATVVKAGDGTPFGMLGIARDITAEVRQRERERFDLRFRSLIADASKRFVQVTDEDSFDQAVDGTLAAFGQLFEIDRAYLFRFSDNLATMDNTHEWCAPGIVAQKDHLQQVPTARLPWWMDQMLQLRPVQIPQVAALPEEAVAEKQEFQAQGIQSLICLPICDDRSRLLGFVGFDAVRAPRQWPDEYHGMLQVLAEILGSTLVRLEAIRVLAENEQQLQLFFSQSLSGFAFMMLDKPVAWSQATEDEKQALLDYVMDHARMTKVNQAMLDQYAADQDDLLGWTPHDMFANDREQGREVMRELFDRGRWHVETREQRLDGTPIIIDGDYICLYDQQGRITGQFNVQNDITERKRAEEALRANKARLQAITDSAQDAIMMMAPDGAISFWNPAAETILGYSAQEAVGQDLHQLLAPERFLEAQQAAFPLFQQTGQGAAIGKLVELAARCKNGREITISLALSAVLLEGQWHAVGILRDITERKQAQEELLAANRRLEAATVHAHELTAKAEAASIAKSEFLANMSHEIRTPMNGVIGMTGLLLDTPLSQEQQHYAKVIKSSGESLLRLINDILDFSKVEAGKLELEIVDFDLQSLLDAVAVSGASQADEKGLELMCFADAGVPTTISGDPSRLQQVLGNLLANAIKFTEAGEVLLRVVLLTKVQENGTDQVVLRFSVQDTGIGIPEDKIGLLFSKFSQVDASTTRHYGGTGLGLAISKQLVELMGGEIGVRSTVGQGSEFWFTARFECRPNAGREKAPMPRGMNGVRVLIVDDNIHNREILRTHLTAWGMRTEEACDGPSGMQALYRAVSEGDHFPLAIIDMHMPGMDGEALGRVIRADVRLSDTRLVMLTSLGMRGKSSQWQALGFSAYLVKPVQHKELKSLLFRVLAEDARPTGAACSIASSRSERKPSPAKPTDTMAARFADRKARILVAEDNAVNQQVALGILKKLGLTVDVVADGYEAVQSLTMLPYDLVLMDVQMPEMDGMEATRQIRRLEAEAKGLWADRRAMPIIAMTAHAMQGDRERCLDAGMNDYVSKPVSPAALAIVLEKWLPPLEHQVARPTEPESSNEGRAASELPSPHIPQPSSLAGPAPPDFDPAVLLERLMGDADLVSIVLQQFLADIPRQIEDLRCCLESGNAAGVALRAHTIKGAAANVTAEPLRVLALELEKAAQAGDLASIQSRLDHLDRVFEHWKQTVESHVAVT